MARLIDQEYDSAGNIIEVTIEDDGYICNFEMVRHGQWITTKIIKSFGTLDGFKCSLCGKECVTRNKFCPNCGAKMDAEVEG